MKICVKKVNDEARQDNKGHLKAQLYRSILQAKSPQIIIAAPTNAIATLKAPTAAGC